MDKRKNSTDGKTRSLSTKLSPGRYYVGDPCYAMKSQSSWQALQEALHNDWRSVVIVTKGSETNEAYTQCESGVYDIERPGRDDITVENVSEILGIASVSMFDSFPSCGVPFMSSEPFWACLREGEIELLDVHCKESLLHVKRHT